jgi:hypothetical protein
VSLGGFVHLSENAALLNQLLRRIQLNDFAAVEHGDAISILNER